LLDVELGSFFGWKMTEERAQRRKRNKRRGEEEKGKRWKKDRLEGRGSWGPTWKREPGGVCLRETSRSWMR
jgi:hypothetical protein